MEIQDGNWTLMDFDPATGRSVWMTIEDDRYVFRIDQPLQSIFDANHHDLMDTMGKRFGEWNRVASVPHHLVYKNGLNEAIEQHDDRYIAKVLNDSDNEKFRTSRGRL